MTARAVRAHLAPFLPGDPLSPADSVVGPVSAARFGSAGILPIPWVYISLMGAEGLRHATETAIVAANYIATRLDDAYPVLYRGERGMVAHECILDLRKITADTGVTVDDVANPNFNLALVAILFVAAVAGVAVDVVTTTDGLASIVREVGGGGLVVPLGLVHVHPHEPSLAPTPIFRGDLGLLDGIGPRAHEVLRHPRLARRHALTESRHACTSSNT